MSAADRPEMALNRRTLLRRVLGWTVCAAGLPLPALSAAQGRGTGTSPQSAEAAPSGTVLLLLGTQGGPNVNLGRAETASAVVVDGQAYLVDCGYGTLRALVQSGLGYNDVAQVFLTHLHDDHTSDLPALLSHKWTSGLNRPATVHGPSGTAALVEAAIGFLKANTEIRMINEGRPERPETMFHGEDAAAETVTQVFRDERVKVTAVENTHFPDRAKAKMAYRSLA